MRREGEIEYSMNVAFAALTLLSLVMMTFAAPADMLPSMISGVSGAIVLILKLTAVYAVWLSVLKMAEATGLDRKLSRALRPVIRRLFKGESEKSYIQDVRRGILSIEFSGNFGVIKTRPGHANSVCFALDVLNLPEILGSLAGDDTIFVILREGMTKEDLLESFQTRIPEIQE